MDILDFIREHQLNIMLSLGNVCGAVALSMLISGLRNRRRRILFFLQLSAALLVIADRNIWIYDGVPGEISWWMIRISSFICYEMTLLLFLTINLYLKELFAENVDLDSSHKRFIFNNFVLISGAVLVFIFQFTNLFPSSISFNE